MWKTCKVLKVTTDIAVEMAGVTSMPFENQIIYSGFSNVFEFLYSNS